MEATAGGQMIGLPIADVADVAEDEFDAKPWLNSPSRKSRPIAIAEPIPSAVHGVLSQRLYIAKAGLPSASLNQIKRLTAFQNPEFYKKQNLRLSTALTPRIISVVSGPMRYSLLSNHPDVLTSAAFFMATRASNFFALIATWT
jgi:hypothetical protein